MNMEENGYKHNPMILKSTLRIKNANRANGAFHSSAAATFDFGT